jgi:hypothetical protein
MDPTTDARVLQAGGDRRAEQQMIKAKAGVSLPAIAQVVPECVDALIAVQFADGIRPALTDQARVG